ncbi:hypothetical protein Lalb_Chr11g0070291 [Lupinus albus]|uniref:Uncharacterized protein n=1 Tax=Lupinus albus TaxID=3870 RepID=A0A6A4PS43_LUPAL|nr:hypothetical protein Lalb_Chr11g0070291 [Lupinus albus]
MKRGGVSATPPNMPLIIKIRKGRGNIIHRFPSSPYSGDVNPDRRGHDSGGSLRWFSIENDSNSSKEGSE